MWRTAWPSSGLRAPQAGCWSRCRAGYDRRRPRDRRPGADLISVGALTHSAPVLDIGLDL